MTQVRAAAIRLLVTLSLTGGAMVSAPLGAAAQDPHVDVARSVLMRTPLFDGHNDLPWAIRGYEAAPMSVPDYELRSTAPAGGHTDIPRLREGMVGAQFWSVYVPFAASESGTAARTQLEQIDIAKQIFDLYPDVFQFATSVSDVQDAFGAGRIGSVMGMEGGHAIENSLGALRAFFELGVRYMTLTHSASIDWADAGTGLPIHDGLTRFGEEVVREMNRMGMLVDLSHTSPATMHDVLDIAEAPVMFSHSSARGVTDHPRNVPDDVLRRLPDNGGVVMITFVPAFVSTEVMEFGQLPPDEQAGRTAPRATMADVIEHIEHVRDVAGIDHVGIGGDFDGITTVVEGLEDVSTYVPLLAELSRRGWTEDELSKLAGENILRVWVEAEEAAARIQRVRGPSTATIEELDGPGSRPLGDGGA